MPAQIRLLHGVLGVSHRPKHAICETEQAPTVRLEARGGIRYGVCGTHAVRTASAARARPSSNVTVVPSPTIRLQGLSWLRASLTVGCIRASIMSCSSAPLERANCSPQYAGDRVAAPVSNSETG